MAYGHAERTLAAIRLLEAQTRELLGGLAHLSPEQSHWLQEVTEADAPVCDGRTPGRQSGNKLANE
jgi:hypothetical protein